MNTVETSAKRLSCPRGQEGKKKKQKRKIETLCDMRPHHEITPVLSVLEHVHVRPTTYSVTNTFCFMKNGKFNFEMTY